MNTQHDTHQAVLEVVLTALDALAQETKRKADKADAARDCDEWAATIATGEYLGVLSAHSLVVDLRNAVTRRQAVSA